MARAPERSLTEIQEEAERNRADLTETVDQLRSRVADTVTDFRHRVTPGAMKAEVGDYLHGRADALMDRARGNPLQAAAIGIGIGYPLFRIARAIPAPVLMVGAGLYLMGTSSGQKATGDLKRKMGEVAGSVSDGFGSGLEIATRKAQDARDAASTGMASASDRVSTALGSVTDQAAATAATLQRGAASLAGSASDLAGSASDRLANLKERAVAAVGSTSSALQESAVASGSMVRDSAGSASDFAASAAQRLRERAVDTSQKAVATANETIQQYPLLVGGLGLALGVLIASALPKSDVEKNIMGGAGAEARKRANALASSGFDAAKGIASGAISSLVSQAGQDHLTSADANAATEDFGRRVRKVAESAADAAFGKSTGKPTMQPERARRAEEKTP